MFTFLEECVFKIAQALALGYFISMFHNTTDTHWNSESIQSAGSKEKENMQLHSRKIFFFNVRILLKRYIIFQLF